MNTDLGSFPICKVSANRGQNKINLFIFYVEVQPMHYSQAHQQAVPFPLGL